MVRRSGFLEWAPPTNRFGGRPPTRQILVAANDAVSWSDAAAVLGEAVVEGVDTIVFGDTAIGGLTSQAAANDTLAFTDSGDGQTVALFGAGEDTITLSDGAVAVMTRIAAAVDSLSRSDSAVALTARVAASSDSLSLSDSAVAGGSGSDPYPWDASFDMNLFAPNTGAGFWGASNPINVAEEPQGSLTEHICNSVSDVADHIYTPQVRLIIRTSLTGGVFNDGDITDVDIVIEEGVVWDSPFFGAFDQSTTTTRLRIRGEIVGTAGSGGQLHQATFFGPGTDLICDSLLQSGPGGNAGALVFGFGWERVAINFCLAQCGGYYYIGTPTDLTIVSSSIQTGMDTVTPAESWGVRSSHEALGNQVLWSVDIRSNPARTNNSHHRYRCHPDPGLLYVWLGYSRLIDRVQSRIFWCNAAAGSGSGTANCVWLIFNNIIAATSDPTDPPPSIEITDTDVAVVEDNDFESDTFLSNSNLTITGVGDVRTAGNGYASLPGSDPAWGSDGYGCGDPSGIPWNF
jgi:hypothetical protein